MNSLVVAHICIFHIIFLVLSPRFPEDCRPSSRVAVAVMSFSSRRRPHRSHLPSGTQGGKRERPNLCGGPAPPHSPRPRDTPFPLGERHRAHPHTTGRASLLCLSLHRISGGQSFHRRCPGEPLTLVFAVS